MIGGPVRWSNFIEEFLELDKELSLEISTIEVLENQCILTAMQPFFSNILHYFQPTA